MVVPLLMSNLSFVTRTGVRAEGTVDPKIICERRRHMINPFEGIHRRSQVCRMLFV